MIFVRIEVTIACVDVIFYVILKQDGQDGPKSLTCFKAVVVQIALVPLCSSDRKLSNIPMKFKRNWPRG